MSRVNFDNIGPLIQGGLSSGAAIGQRNRALDMEQEQRAIQNEAMRFELTQRRQAAADLLAQRDADTQILSALQGAAKVDAATRGPTGPRPSSWRDQLPGAQPADGGDAKTTQPVSAVPWDATIPPHIKQQATMPVKAMMANAGRDPSRLTGKAIKAADNYEYMKSIGMAKYMPEGLWDEMLALGVQPEEGDIPESILTRMHNLTENVKKSQIELLTTSDVEDGEEPRVDMQRRLALLGEDPALVKQVFDTEWPIRKAIKEKRQAEAQLFASINIDPAVLARGSKELRDRVLAHNAQPHIERAYTIINDPNSSPELRGKAQAYLTANKIPMPQRAPTDPLADDVIRIQFADATQRASAAIDVYNSALANYQRVNIDKKGKTRGLAPPTDAERERLKYPAVTDFGDGVSDMDESAYERLKGRVDAWDRLMDAKAAAERAESNRSALVQRITGQGSSRIEQDQAGSDTIERPSDDQVDAALAPRPDLSIQIGPDGSRSKKLPGKVEPENVAAARQSVQQAIAALRAAQEPVTKDNIKKWLAANAQ